MQKRPSVDRQWDLPCTAGWVPADMATGSCQPTEQLPNHAARHRCRPAVETGALRSSQTHISSCFRFTGYQWAFSHAAAHCSMCCRYVYMPQVKDHMVPWEAPDELNKLLVSFLSEHKSSLMSQGKL